MSKNEKPNASNNSGKGQINRVGTSALIAATSLLGTALGVSDATATEPHVTGSPSHASTKPSPPEEKGKGKGFTFLKYELKNVAVTSHSISAKKPSSPSTKVGEPVVRGKK